jgi:hypothetical protein
MYIYMCVCVCAGQFASIKVVSEGEEGEEAWLPAGVAPSDAALAGVLCGLASLERSAIRSRLVDAETFAALLPLAASLGLRPLLNDYMSSRYSALFTRLAALRPRLLLDVHLAKHAEVLLQTIRRKALAQYASPYSSIGKCRRVFVVWVLLFFTFFQSIMLLLLLLLL